MIKIMIVVVLIGIITAGIMWCCSKIGSDGNWYSEHMAENTPDNDSEK